MARIGSQRHRDENLDIFLTNTEAVKVDLKLLLCIATVI
jgi:hypothetical protein